jgi:hypothetical protein
MIPKHARISSAPGMTKSKGLSPRLDFMMWKVHPEMTKSSITDSKEARPSRTTQLPRPT